MQFALWISYELVLTAAGFVVKMSDINSTKCSFASVIPLVFLCSVCFTIFDKACSCASENTSVIFFVCFSFLFFSYNSLKQYLSARNLLWSNDHKTLVFSVGFQERAHCAAKVTKLVQIYGLRKYAQITEQWENSLQC